MGGWIRHPEPESLPGNDLNGCCLSMLNACILYLSIHTIFLYICIYIYILCMFYIVYYTLVQRCLCSEYEGVSVVSETSI